jgi:hypothetical protein
MITTIENGINFQDKDRYFTNTQFESGLGYYIWNDIQVSVELDNEIVLLQTDLLVDGVLHLDMTSFITALGLQ